MGAAALTIVLGAAIAVRGVASCPTAAEVSEALAALSPAGATPASGDWADIAPDGDSVRVRLLQADGTLLAEKRLAAGPCRQRAETAAVVLAAWASQFHPEVAFSIDTPPPAAPDSGPPALAVVARAPPPSRESAPLVFVAGAGLLASVQGDSLAPAGTIEARLAPARSGWGGRLAMRATGMHRLAFGPGEADWRRVGVSAGVLRRQELWRRVAAEAGVDVVSGLVFATGDGYSIPRSSRSLDLGVEVGVRLGFILGRIEPWLGVALCGWLRPQIIEVSGIPERDRLPAFDARLGIGANVAFGP
jgi:hypothetical protein